MTERNESVITLALDDGAVSTNSALTRNTDISGTGSNTSEEVQTRSFTTDNKTKEEGDVGRSEVDELVDLVNMLWPNIRRYVAEHGDPDIPTVKHRTPEELRKEIDLSMPEHGHSIEEIEGFIKNVMDKSVRTGAPLFMDKLYAGSDPIGQMAEWICATLNTAVHVFGAAPVFTVVEHEVVKKCGELFGFKACDGVFGPGGSYVNFVAMLLARNKNFPRCNKMGWQAGDEPVVMTSAQGHYSMPRGALMMGMGDRSVVQVKCNMQGQMDPDDLEAKVVQLKKEGRNPFLVNPIAGTTVLGGYDLFNEIADVCEKHGLWMHIDACWGGGVVVSDSWKHLMKGCERADSISWNPHKMLSVPLQCSVLLVKEHGHLVNMFTKQAEYLFHGNSMDMSTKTPQCGRKPDAFKLWLCWKRHGRLGYQNRVNKAFDLVNYFKHQLNSNPNFHMVTEPPSLNVCFWYVPASLQGTEDDPRLPDAIPSKRLAEVTAAIHTRLRKDGQILIDFAPLPDQDIPHFFRVIISSPNLTYTDIDYIMSEIERNGADL